MIYFHKVNDLTTIGPEIPFIVKRIYWIKPKGQNRGNHAHRKLKQVIVCAQGFFTLKVDSGREIKEYKLCGWNPEGVYVSTEWLKMTECSDDCMILVFASDFYDEADYIRDKKIWKGFIDGTLSET